MNFRVFKKRLSALTDEELANRYRETLDMEYVGELFERYRALMYGVALKYLNDREKSRDAVMDITESLSNKLASHRIENFSSWLHSVVRNHCLMQIRKQRKPNQSDNSNLYMELLSDLHQNDEEKANQLNLLEYGLKHLSDEQHRCIRMFYLEQKSYREVSDITGFTMKKVKSHIQNGKRNLKLFIEKHDDG